MKSVHKGVKYSCERCYYEATKKVVLQRHVASNHERVIQSCDLCKMWLLTWGRQQQRVAISQSNQQMNMFSMLKYFNNMRGGENVENLRYVKKYWLFLAGPNFNNSGGGEF